MKVYPGSIFLIPFLFILVISPNEVFAQANNDGRQNIGIGLMAGEPTGVTFKSWFNRETAYDIGAAWSLSGRNEAVHLHANFLYHLWFEESDNLAFTFGIGGRVIFAGDAKAGVRIPLGLNYVFDDAPFDMFVEAVPILDLSPDVEFAGNGAFGVRYYF
ncbi:MAG: hypothetical protein R6V27_11120 [Balneolaceae bacterium]